MQGSFSSHLPTSFDYILLTNHDHELIKSPLNISNKNDQGDMGHFAIYIVMKVSLTLLQLQVFLILKIYSISSKITCIQLKYREEK